MCFMCIVAKTGFDGYYNMFQTELLWLNNLFCAFSESGKYTKDECENMNEIIFEYYYKSILDSDSGVLSINNICG